jgi:hypothetical protein
MDTTDTDAAETNLVEDLSAAFEEARRAGGDGRVAGEIGHGCWFFTPPVTAPEEPA